MSDDKPDRKRVPHEYTTKEPESRRTDAEKAARGPIRRTRFLFKFIGFLLFIAVVWWAWTSYRKGGMVDITDPNQQRQLIDQAKTDVSDAADATRKASVVAIDWARQSLGDLEKFIKGKPPKTQEEIKELVDESKRDVAKEQAKPAAPASASPTPAPPSPLAAAQAEFRAGQEAYVMTDPMASQEQVQKYIRIAAPHFEKCLALCDALRSKGINGDEIGRLEQAAARRLYDCHKRMELKAGER